jgi:hypothetical protein
MKQLNSVTGSSAGQVLVEALEIAERNDMTDEMLPIITYLSALAYLEVLDNSQTEVLEKRE